MRVARPLSLFAAVSIALAGAAGTAAAVPAVPAAPAPAPKAAAAGSGYAAPTMLHCKLNVRSGTRSSATLLRTLHNRNGNCPGKSGHDSIPCWLNKCGGITAGGSYTCQSGGTSYKSWLPVKHKGKRAWVAIKCGTYVTP
ncbi:hypothetical protein B590_00494 [Streptomyces sp. PVA_94-07]|uniref:hypothetical protein n=1 Tax=Streptomyces sp. PVA_94-07 TaxID=1225337 RepID=UPI0003C2F6E6|nr:hypothetical protein [Streptomyces sp. PVA_94-07]ESQ07466.1 hypothetical protein B590_00494 [Streptomyces sp. PVA_94-07]